jgi:hypothetical protein
MDLLRSLSSREHIVVSGPTHPGMSKDHCLRITKKQSSKPMAGGKLSFQEHPDGCMLADHRCTQGIIKEEHVPIQWSTNKP